MPIRGSGRFRVQRDLGGWSVYAPDGDEWAGGWTWQEAIDLANNYIKEARDADTH